MQFSKRRIFLVFFFLSVLTGSLIWIYVIFPPLRVDAIPDGAYIVPWMKPNPSIEELNMYSVDSPPWDIDIVMANALKIEMTFRIEIPNGIRIIPSTVYLGHDEDYLYIGGKFRGMYKNPVKYIDRYTNQKLTLVNYFSIYFDVANDGILTFPESGSEIQVTLLEDAGWHTGKIWFYEDLFWGYSPVSKREVWRYASHYYYSEPQPATALKNMAVQYDNSTGTLIIVFSRYLRRPELPINALQMKRRERWVMGFLIEIGYDNWEGEWADFVDGWPKKIYPFLSNNSSWWPKLVIDLTNPQIIGVQDLVTYCLHSIAVSLNNSKYKTRNKKKS